MKTFITNLINALAPPENRLVAAVAGMRTFFQTIRGSAAVGAIVGAGVTVNDIVNIDWTLLGYSLLAITATATIAGLDSYFNNLANGLSPKYAEAVVATVANGDGTDKMKDAVVEAAKKVT